MSSILGGHVVQPGGWPAARSTARPLQPTPAPRPRPTAAGCCAKPRRAAPSRRCRSCATPAPDGVDRFPLGVASSQSWPGGVVLWTRLIGADLPERVPVQWEIADDEAFARIAARGSEVAERAAAYSVHAAAAGLAPSRWYWYRHHEMGGAVAPRRLQLQHHLACTIALHRPSASVSLVSRPPEEQVNVTAAEGCCTGRPDPYPPAIKPPIIPLSA